MCIYLYVIFVYLKERERINYCVTVLISHNPCNLLPFCLSNRYGVPFKHKATGLNRLIAVM